MTTRHPARRYCLRPCAAGWRLCSPRRVVAVFPDLARAWDALRFLARWEARR